MAAAERAAAEVDGLAARWVELDPLDAALAETADPSQDLLAQALAEVEAAAAAMGEGEPDPLAAALAAAPEERTEAIDEHITEQQAYANALRMHFPDSQTVYVRNLEGDDDLEPEDLLAHFQYCGEVKKITIKIDRATGARVGHACIDFATDHAADTAVELDGSEFAGRTIRVSKKRRSQPNGFGWKGGKGKDWYGKAGYFPMGWGKGWGDWDMWGKDWGKGKGRAWRPTLGPY